VIKRKKWLIVVASALAVGALLLFLARRPCCGEADRSELAFEATLGRAIDGDLQAIETLHGDYAKAGRMEQARSWALFGAIHGSRKMTDAYEAARRQEAGFNTSGEDIIILKNLSRPGAADLASRFKITAAPTEH